MANNVVHFAIHADDVDRARRFYGAVFGWRFEAWGPPGFFRVHTGTADEPGIEGALHERAEPLEGPGDDSEAAGSAPGTTTVRRERSAASTRGIVMRGFECTVSVNDLPAVRERVVANGGTIVYEEVEIPTVGTLVQFLDTEGNVCNAMHYVPGMPGSAG
jgi:hypothetical protein